MCCSNMVYSSSSSHLGPWHAYPRPKPERAAARKLRDAPTCPHLSALQLVPGTLMGTCSAIWDHTGRPHPHFQTSIVLKLSDDMIDRHVPTLAIT